MAKSCLPLEGVKCVCVITLQQLAVAFIMLANLGGGVIKIEPPGTGESARCVQLIPGQKLSPYFETHNRYFPSTEDLRLALVFQFMVWALSNSSLKVLCARI